MGTQPICSECKRLLPPNAPQGLCPECLIKAGLPTGIDIGPDTESDLPGNPFVPPAPAELAPFFPQLEILALIGQGGMGAVYQARQKPLDRIVALKILPPGIGEEAAFTERFTREAKALARLNHPGIVTLYEFGQVSPPSPVSPQPLYYFLMEFVDGVNLRQLLAKERLSTRETLAIVPQICEALQFAHDQGIVHRDIKPENILIDRRGRVKVADFGLAKLVAAASDGHDSPEEAGRGAPSAVHDQLTDGSKILGTPQYMAPEQLAAPGEVDQRADIYALGVVFYQMLTGELPGKPLEAPSRKVHIDVRLDEVVLRALQKDPALRYQQVSLLKTQVETIAGTSPVAGSADGSSATRWRWLGTNRHRLAWGLVLLVGLALPTVSFWHSRAGGRAAPLAAPTLPMAADNSLIVEGEGWKGFKVGATRAELIQTLGQPDSASEANWLQWQRNHSVDCLIDDALGAFELRFNPGFQGTTQSGIGIGSPLTAALAAYGEPSSREANGVGKKLIWSSKGILIWFSEDKVTQIVVFRKQ